MTTLRRRMLALVGGVVAILALIALVVGTLFVVFQTRALESRVLQQDAQRITRLLERDAEHLDRFVCDWAFWDDTCEFVEHGSSSYETSNLIPETFQNSRIHFMVFVNRAGEIVYARAYDGEKAELVPLDSTITAYLRDHELLKGYQTSDDLRRGLILVGGRLYLVAARTILRSNQSGPARGALMMGRMLDEAAWQTIADSLLLDISVVPAEPHGEDAYFKRLAALRGETSVLVEQPGMRVVYGYFLLWDINRRPVAVVRVQVPRSTFLSPFRNALLFWGILGIVCVGAVWAALGGVNRIVLARTAQLHDFVTALRSKDTLSERVKVGGEDEIAALGESINLLLDKLQTTMTELQRTQANLQEQQQFLRQVIDAHPGYVWVKDEQHRFVLVNRGLANFCQTRPEQMVGRPDSDFNPNKEEVERFHREDDEVRRTGQPLFVPEERITALNGSHIWISTYKVPLRAREGRIRQVLAVAVDITDLKRGQEALRQSEARYRRLYENAPVAILLWDKEGRVLGWNPFAERMFGWTRREALWRNWIELLIPSEDREMMVEIQRAVFSGRTPIMATSQALSKGGALLYCEWHHAAIIDDNGQVAAGLSFAADVTDQRRVEEEKKHLEAQVQQAQKLESLGVLAGGIAHDFNNILMAILGNADLALAELPPNSPVRTTVEEIILGSRRAADLCRQLLAYSGHGRFVIEPLDLNKVVQEMTRMFEVAISKKATLRIECAPALPAIEADGTQVRQVLMNLIMNASEAIRDSSGVIRMRTGVTDCSREFLNRTMLGSRLEPGPYVFVEVTDTGCGMDSNTLARVFEPFFSTKFTGRGLGLAAVLGIMKSHDGTIEVHSQPGEGTTFRVYFPVSDKAAEQTTGNGSPVAWRGSGTILVVDDEETVRVLAARMLERCGFKILTAGDGQEALAVLRAHIQEVTAVLLDLTMPRMDGQAVLAEIRKLGADLPVVLSSGYSEQDLAAKFQGIPKVAFLEKPYTRSGLIAAFRKLLHA